MVAEIDLDIYSSGENIFAIGIGYGLLQQPVVISSYFLDGQGELIVTIVLSFALQLEMFGLTCNVNSK